MVNIQEKIGNLFPDAIFDEGEVLCVTIPDAQWHTMAKALKEDADLDFDYLVSIIGMDWKDMMGCMYYFTSTKRATHLSVKVTTEDRDNPMLHSITDLWASANLYEREVFDFYGIKFINHPDMRRLFLRNDWVGYPFRKDYDDNPDINPIRLNHEAIEDSTVSYVEDSEGKITKKEKIVFEPQEYVVNIGPQHPATHGVLRFRTSLDGEKINKIDLYCGYIHRGIEKLCEGLTYPQTLHFTDRLDYLSAQQNRHCLCLCVEKAMELEVPRRAQVIRVMMDELMRISSHLLFFGTFCMDLGATTALFYGFRERELILDIFEKTCGARMTFNYNTIGGVIADLHPDFQKQVKEFCAVMPARLKEYHQLFTGNVIAQNRMKGVGHLTTADAISYGITGPSGRASGWACDIRKTSPYAVYGELDFEEVILHEGDVFDRYMARMKEIEESIKILEQLVDNIPEGDYCAKVPKIIKLPVGHWFQQVEASRGAFGVYIESTGEKTPYRVKFNSPGLALISVIDHITRGSKIADLISIGGSLDYVVPDIDR
ncbi:MAG: NADH-quinone oxidoreductase subunit D [Muribaculaceae bacterium]